MSAWILWSGWDAAVLAQLVGAVGAILAALISVVGRRVRRVEVKIDGLRNGTYHQAMAAIAQLQREREERRIAGLPARRVVDRIAPDPAPAAVVTEVEG